MSKIAVLGSGVVGQTLADGCLAEGHEVMRASREPAKLSEWKSGAGAAARVGTLAEAARWATTVILAVKGAAAEAAVDQAGPENLAGKTVIDATNPIAEDAPPQNGVLRFFTNLDESLMEKLQRKAPDARFVKAFNSVGAGCMVHPKLPGGPPTMFICGSHSGAKDEVRALLEQFGWETADMGNIEAARAIEPLCMLWCIPGFRENRWGHAFKLLRA